MKRATGRDASRVTLHDRVGARHFSLGARLPSRAKEEGTHPLWGAGALSHRAQPPEHPALRRGLFTREAAPSRSSRAPLLRASSKIWRLLSPTKVVPEGGTAHPGGAAGCVRCFPTHTAALPAPRRVCGSPGAVRCPTQQRALSLCARRGRAWAPRACPSARSPLPVGARAPPAKQPRRAVCGVGCCPPVWNPFGKGISISVACFCAGPSSDTANRGGGRGLIKESLEGPPAFSRFAWFNHAQLKAECTAWAHHLKGFLSTGQLRPSDYLDHGEIEKTHILPGDIHKKWANGCWAAGIPRAAGLRPRRCPLVSAARVGPGSPRHPRPSAAILPRTHRSLSKRNKNAHSVRFPRCFENIR